MKIHNCDPLSYVDRTPSTFRIRIALPIPHRQPLASLPQSPKIIGLVWIFLCMLAADPDGSGRSSNEEGEEWVEESGEMLANWGSLNREGGSNLLMSQGWERGGIVVVGSTEVIGNGSRFSGEHRKTYGN